MKDKQIHISLAHAESRVQVTKDDGIPLPRRMKGPAPDYLAL